jgi:hypothetical protein
MFVTVLFNSLCRSHIFAYVHIYVILKFFGAGASKTYPKESYDQLSCIVIAVGNTTFKELT